MGIYYTIPYLTIFFIYIFFYYYEKKNKISQKQKKNLEILSCIIFIFYFGLRGFIATDCFQYHDYFTTLSPRDFSSYNDHWSGEMEIGYAIYNYIIRQFTDSYFLFQLISTCFDVILLHKIIRREGEKYYFLFFALLIPIWAGTQINLYRNIKGILLFVYSIQYIREKRIIPFFILNIIGFSFHNSSLLFFPLYFIARYESKRIYFIITIVAYSIYFIGIGKLIPSLLLISSLIEGKVENVMASYIDNAESSGFTFGFFFRSFLLFFLFAFYDKLKENKIILSLFFYYLWTYLIFSDILVFRDRFTVLFSLAPCIMIPYIASLIRNRLLLNSYKLFISLFLIAYIYVQYNNKANEYENILFSAKTYEQRKRINFLDK